MSIKELLAEANTSSFASKSKNDFYEIEEGNKNLIKILTKPVIYYKDHENGVCYTDCGFTGTPVGMSYVLDKRDPNNPVVKIASLKYKLLKFVANAEESGDYEGIEQYPMVYDIRITKEGKGITTKYEYSIAPKTNKATEDVLSQLEELKPCEEIIEKMKEKNRKERGVINTSEVKEVKEITSDEIKMEIDEIDEDQIPF